MSNLNSYPMIPSRPVRSRRASSLVLVWLYSLAIPAFAQETAPPPPSPPVEVETSTPAPAAATDPNVEADRAPEDPSSDEPFARHPHDHNVILRFADTNVGPDEHVDAVISIGGSSTSAGVVREAVVSVFGNTHVTGPVGDSAVAVFGNVYVNSSVRGDVVAVLGDVELGPEARVGGEVVVVSGALKRDAAATVGRGIQQVTLPMDFGRFEWLRPWIKHCLLYGRPLALEPGLGWAWTLAIGFLTFYILLALMFSSSVEKCVATFESRPGQTLVASILTLILTPILTLVLAVTVIGVALVPFLWFGLFVAGLFGKAVVLAALGRRLTGAFGSGSPHGDVALAVLVGGLILLGVYLVPVLGFIAYKVVGILGLGTIAYTLLLAAQEKRQVAAAVAGGAAVQPLAQPASVADFGIDSPAAAASAAAATAPVAPTIADSELPRAGFWIRMAALLVDIILVGVIFSLISADDIFLPVLAAYGAIMWKLRGTTVGGILCNLKVVRADGRPIDWPTASVRALSCFLSLVVAGLGFLWIVFDKNRQSWHDKIAGTLVVRVPQGVSLL